MWRSGRTMALSAGNGEVANILIGGSSTHQK